MKSSNWIKIIGISCIVFGASGILSNLTFLLLPEINGMEMGQLSEVSPELSRLATIFIFLEMVAYTIYLLSGIFFLMKRSFSLTIMYISLIFSIVCRIFEMLYLNLYSSVPSADYEINIFSLSGLLIDGFLLIAVYRVSKFYFSTDDKYISLPGEKILKSLTSRLLIILTIISFSLFLVSVLITGLWIHAFNLGNSQASRVAVFNSYFPDILQGSHSVTYLSIVFCILAIVISSICLKSTGKIWRMNMIILVLSSLLLLLNLFQMM